MSAPAIALRNQENAQHSTGPRTKEGKQKSSLNALRHGLTSQLVVLPTEDHAEYTRFRAELLADLKPQGTTESLLANTVCDTHWRLERARNTETNILALAQFEGLPANIDSVEDAEKRQALASAHAYLKYERVLRNLQHHEARLQRILLKTLAELKALQLMREQEAARLLDQAACTKIHHVSNNLPFDPAELGFVFTQAEIDAELKRQHVLAHPRKPFLYSKSPTDKPTLNTEVESR